MEYIHINEAVNKYAKTRQTFYNYIRKGLVKSKKVNNKLYLKIEDIEKVLSDYIGIVWAWQSKNEFDIRDEEIIVIDPENNTSPHYTPAEVDDIKQSIHKTYAQLSNKLHMIKQDQLFENKNLHYALEQKILSLIHKQEQDIVSCKHTIKQLGKKMQLRTKKQSFRVWYVCFVLINMIITLYIL